MKNIKQFKELLICFVVVISALFSLFTLERKGIIEFTTNTPTTSGIIEKKFYEVGGSVHNVKQNNYFVIHGSSTPVLVDSYTYNRYSEGSYITLYKENATVYFTFFITLCVLTFLLLFIVFINVITSKKGYLDEVQELYTKEKN